jgi:hypothetical protein
MWCKGYCDRDNSPLEVKGCAHCGMLFWCVLGLVVVWCGVVRCGAVWCGVFGFDFFAVMAGALQHVVMLQHLCCSIYD